MQPTNDFQGAVTATGTNIYRTNGFVGIGTNSPLVIEPGGTLLASMA